MGVLCEILSLPHNIVMVMNNVMFCVLLNNDCEVPM